MGWKMGDVYLFIDVRCCDSRHSVPDPVAARYGDAPLIVYSRVG